MVNDLLKTLLIAVIPILAFFIGDFLRAKKAEIKEAVKIKELDKHHR